jgi:hypothetical protein
VLQFWRHFSLSFNSAAVLKAFFLVF